MLFERPYIRKALLCQTPSAPSIAPEKAPTRNHMCFHVKRAGAAAVCHRTALTA
jgi:hypothetical protein